ncbi:MAG: diguanylate cyclase [Candidatus Cloacimonetes bacterium]|nr:diguanylate cyclase [Candidatus Cloacimonadota bacterium]
MKFKLAEFDDLLNEIHQDETLEYNLEKIVKDIEKDIEFESLGIFITKNDSNNYFPFIHRNLPDDFVLEKNSKMLEMIIQEKRLDFFDSKKFKFEHDYKHLIILPIIYKDHFFGFLSLDRKNTQFSDEDIHKLEMFKSIIEMQMQICKQGLELKKIKKIDDITKVYTLHSFLDQGNLLLAQTNRYHRYLTLIVMGIDDSQKLKDKFDQKYYDNLRMLVAKKLNDDLRESDLVGVVDEQNFAILLPETPVSIIYKAIERLNDSILSIPEIDGTLVSWGIAGKDENIAKIKQLLSEAMEAKEESEYKDNDKITFYH